RPTQRDRLVAQGDGDDPPLARRERRVQVHRAADARAGARRRCVFAPGRGERLVKLHLETLDRHTSFRPGDTVEGVAGWEPGPGEDPPDRVEVRLFWHTAG